MNAWVLQETCKLNKIKRFINYIAYYIEYGNKKSKDKNRYKL